MPEALSKTAQLADDADMDRVRVELRQSFRRFETRLVAWIIAQGLAVIGILFALLRFVEK